MEQYKLDKKNFKGFSDQQLADWRGSIETSRQISFFQNHKQKLQKLLMLILKELQTKWQVNSRATERSQRLLKKLHAGKLSFLKKTNSKFRFIFALTIL
jgi:hypothetical protein